MSLLTVNDLSVSFVTRNGTTEAVKNVSFNVESKSITAIIGESGSGKSVSCYALLGLIPQPPGRVDSGTAEFGGRDLLSLSERELRGIRGSDIAMIFQDPMTCLNPYMRIGEQLIEPLIVHGVANKEAATKRAVELLDEVGIQNPEVAMQAYPFEFSGGMRQRVMIAMALIAEPKLLIADEPTTALDVTVQAQIFDLLSDLRRQTGAAIILITHDMGAVAEMAERMIVMYAGRKAEFGPVDQIINHPRHPYTKGLISCVPHIVSDMTEERPDLVEVPGIVPSLKDFGQDRCLFASRCTYVTDKCRASRPEERLFSDGQIADCWHAEDL